MARQKKRWFHTRTALMEIGRRLRRNLREGEVEDWNEVMDFFKATLHDRDMDDRKKVNALIGFINSMDDDSEDDDSEPMESRRRRAPSTPEEFMEALLR